MFLSLVENNVVPKPNKAINANDQRKLDTCAIKPITGGPNKNPRKLMVDTAANANSGDMVLDFPARPYTIGTTQETPIPTNKQPATAAYKYGNKTIINKPDAISVPLNCNIFFTPNFVISQSPKNLPVAIVAIKET